MTFRDLLRYATGALSGHGLRTGLSMLGVGIGVASVIILTALGEGARRYVVEQFASLGTNLLIVIPGRTDTTGGIPGIGGVPNDLTLDDAEALRRLVPQARLLSPVSSGTETVSYRQRSRQVPVLGTSHEFLEVRGLAMQQGSFLPATDWDRGTPVVVLGPTLVTELFPGESPIGRVVRIGEFRMRVIGVMERQGLRLGVDMDEVVVVPIATGLRMFNRSSLFRILIKVPTTADLAAAEAHVRDVIVERHDEDDVTVITQDAVIETFSQILGVLTMALGGIAAISLTVAGVGIMNVMLVSVSERTQEIGLLKAVGAKPRQILAAFLAEAVLLSASGGIVGLAAGWAVVRIGVQAFPSVPASPPDWAVAAALAISVGVGTIFGVVPAKRATGLDPVTALAKR